MQTSDAPRSPTSAAREIPEQFRSQRHRLAKVIDLARVYRDCGVEELARDLGRDPTRLVSDSGNPKIDLVIGLSRVLEWPVTEVVKAIRGDDGVPEPPASNSKTFQKYSELMEESLKAHRSGRWQELLDIAKAMLVTATTPDEHALACNRMSGAFDGMGRYAHALKTLQQGMNEHGVSESVGILLRANLANAHYALWNLAEARAISGEVIDEARPIPGTKIALGSGVEGRDDAHYVRASTYQTHDRGGNQIGANEKLGMRRLVLISGASRSRSTSHSPKSLQ